MIGADCLPKNTGADWVSSTNVDIKYGFDNFSQNLCVCQGFSSKKKTKNKNKQKRVFGFMDQIPTV